jgi:hypothetical protein
VFSAVQFCGSSPDATPILRSDGATPNDLYVSNPSAKETKHVTVNFEGSAVQNVTVGHALLDIALAHNDQQRIMNHELAHHPKIFRSKRKFESSFKAVAMTRLLRASDFAMSPILFATQITANDAGGSQLDSQTPTCVI